MDDVRYSELLFLRALANRRLEFVSGADANQAHSFLLNQHLYVELVVALLEDLCVQLDDRALQLLVGRLRREVAESLNPRPHQISEYSWLNPRQALHDLLTTDNPQRVRITYRGLRRLDELRERLRYDRILDDFGVLLSFRYLNADLDHALERSPDAAVSVLYADMDGFGPINKQFGHDAGDVVMKAYLETMRDSIGQFGSVYRGSGDEVVAIIVGQGHGPAIELAELARKSVASLRCKFGDVELPGVTTSIGVATTPPEKRARELSAIAEARNRTAKEAGKNRVIAI